MLLENFPLRGYLQLFSLLISLFSLVLILYTYQRFSTAVRYCLIAPAIWLFHNFIFYVFVLIQNVMYGFIPSDFFTNWSAWLRLNGLITILGVIILHYRYRSQAITKKDLIQWGK